MSFTRKGALAALLTVAALALPSTALASTSVVQAIKAQTASLKASPAVQKLIQNPPRTKAEAKKDIPLFVAVQKKLTSAANVVNSSSATSKQKAGKAEWVAGVRGLAKGYGQLIAGFKLIGGSNSSQAKQDFLAAAKTLKASAAEVKKAESALGIS